MLRQQSTYHDCRIPKLTKKRKTKQSSATIASCYYSSKPPSFKKKKLLKSVKKTPFYSPPFEKEQKFLTEHSTKLNLSQPRPTLETSPFISTKKRGCSYQATPESHLIFSQNTHFSCRAPSLTLSQRATHSSLFLCGNPTNCHVERSDPDHFRQSRRLHTEDPAEVHSRSS